MSDAAGTGASGATRKRYHVGQAARIPTGGMEVRNPYDVGLIEDADMLGAIWSHGVSQLRVDSREHPLIIVEPAHSLPLHREEMLRMAFDTLGAPAVYLAKAPVMQAFALGRASALVIDIGASGSRTVGVYDGHILKQGQVISEVGGNVISSALLGAYWLHAGVPHSTHHMARHDAMPRPRLPQSLPIAALSSSSSAFSSASAEMLQRTGVMAPQTELLPRALLTKKQRRVPVDGMQVDGEGVGSSSASGATKLVWDVQKRMDLISPAPGTGRRPVTRSFRDVWVLHDVLDDIKHCCASVTDVGFGEEGAKPPLKEHKYELPDGTLLRVKDPLQVCPELHFRPGQYYMQFQHTLTRAQTGNAWHTLYGVDLIQRERPRQDHAPSIQAMMLASLSTCPAEVRKDLSHHIVLTGGGSLLEGLPERLKWEVMALIPQAFKPRILPASPSERQYGSWIGASILASLGTFQQMWISKAEYEEQGAAWALENRCF